VDEKTGKNLGKSIYQLPSSRKGEPKYMYLEEGKLHLVTDKEIIELMINEK